MQAWLANQLRDESTMVHRVAKAANDVFYNKLHLGNTVLDRYLVAPLKTRLMKKND